MNTSAAIVALTLAAGSAIVAPTARAQAEGDAALPVQAVTLYRSGVGAFTREGLIDGSQTVSLRFETDQINDILKSMIVLDLDGGRVSTVSYGSQEPLNRRLASFAIDVSGNTSVTDLLKQLRGAEVTLNVTDRTVSGVVISTESRSVPNEDGAGSRTLEYINLLEDDGAIVSVRLSDVRSFRLEDEELQAELTRALRALADNRTERVKTVDLSFDGRPGRGRRVVVSYVMEMPVWKTSYRLVLPDTEENDPTLQGWAVVENTTDHDWNDVTLSLASGRPVSFTMDLYEPLFAPRPEVPVPFLGGIAPRVYEAVGNLARRESRAAQRRAAPSAGRGAGRYTDVNSDAAESELPRELYSFDAGQLADYAPQAQASAGQTGEQFMYTVDAPVTIERQRSAMLPIINQSLEGRRVSIYNAVANPTFPMRGAELTNDAGLHLMPGPISVYDDGQYAGDAQIPHTSRGQTRLLSYAVDLDVRARTESSGDNRVTRIRIVDGLVEQTTRYERTTEYIFSSNDPARERTLLVEHPRTGYDLVSPEEPAETLPAMYRFELELPAGEDASLVVNEENVRRTSFALVSMDLDTLAAYTGTGRASEQVAQAIRKAASIQAEIQDKERRLDRLSEELEEITRDQRRLRDNMGSIDRNTDLYARYLTKLGEQETRVEEIETQRDRLQDEKQRKDAELRSFLRGLSVK